MKSNITRQDYSLLKEQIVQLVQDLKSCETALEQVATRTKELGLTLPPIESETASETELQYLARLATLCITRERELSEQEERQEIRDMLSGNSVPLRPKTKVGRLLNRLSAAIG